jgi:hypothetical protein
VGEAGGGELVGGVEAGAGEVVLVGGGGGRGSPGEHEPEVGVADEAAGELEEEAVGLGEAAGLDEDGGRLEGAGEDGGVDEEAGEVGEVSGHG